MTDLRSSNTQLPDAAAFLEIFNKEARRTVDVTKADVHYPDFTVIQELVKKIQIPAYWLNTPDGGDMFQRATWVLKHGSDWVRRVARRGLNDVRDGVLDDLYDYLAEHDEPQHVDTLVVLGGKTLKRPQKAAEIYKSNLAERVIVTGYGPNYASSSHRPEWKIYFDEMVNLGVPKRAIHLEKQAISTPDYAFRSLNYLDKQKGGYKRLGIVTTDWNLRRGWVHFMKMSPEGTQIFRFGSGTIPESSRREWCKNRDQISIILNEFVKMRAPIETNTA